MVTKYTKWKLALGGLKNDIQEREKRGKIKESLAEKMFQSEMP